MPKWRQIGTKVEAKTGLNTKTPQSLKCYKNQYFFNKFGVRGDRFENQNRSTISEKTELRSKCVPTSMFNRFLVYFGSILAPKSTKQTIKQNIEKTTSEKRGPREPNDRFWAAGGDKSVPSWVRGGGRGRVTPPPGDISYKELGKERLRGTMGSVKPPGAQRAGGILSVRGGVG